MEHLRSLKLTWSQVPSILGVSVKTLQRRAEEWNLNTYTDISDNNLDDMVRTILLQFPHAGKVMLNGHLISRDVHLQCSSLRSSIHRVRRQTQIHPGIFRSYNVPCPNHLWHAGGNHKLIRYRLITHAAIDGFSRLITFINCANNNTAETVLELFISATLEYGLPSCIQTYRGSENIGVWRYMVYMRGDDCGSYIAGSSVYNSKIERLWRDVCTNVLSTYSVAFYTLEDEGVLDIDNEVDLFCLHYIYIPHIQDSLQAFKQACNHHALSTEGNWSHMQLFTAYSLGNPLFDSNDQQVDIQSYGIDLNVDGIKEESQTEVSVSEITYTLTNEAMLMLRSSINPRQASNSYGVDLFMNTVALVFNLIENER